MGANRWRSAWKSERLPHDGMLKTENQWTPKKLQRNTWLAPMSGDLACVNALSVILTRTFREFYMRKIKHHHKESNKNLTWRMHLHILALVIPHESAEKSRASSCSEVTLEAENMNFWARSKARLIWMYAHTCVREYMLMKIMNSYCLTTDDLKHSSHLPIVWDRVGLLHGPYFY